MIRVCGPLSLSVSAAVPTATIRFPRIASDCAMVKRSSTVTILPLTRMVSAGCACAAPLSPVSKPIANAPQTDQRIVLLLAECCRTSLGGSLGDLDVGGFDDRAPLVHLILEVGPECLGCRADNYDAKHIKLGLDGGLGQDGHRVGMDL